MAESYRYKVYINLGLGLLLFAVLVISMFTKIEFYEKVMLEFSGIVIALLIINGLEWLRLEEERIIDG